MRRRVPRFGLVLPALVAAAALALVLAGGGHSHPPSSNQTPTIGIGPTRACITTGAEARVTDRSAIVVTATVQSPVSVTERASGPLGIATVTRSELVTARVRADEPVEVQRTSAARARACANGNSGTSARGAALQQAYARALDAAHASALHQSAESLATAMHDQYPAVLAEAHARAAVRAHELALAAEAALAAQAQAQARRRAGA